MAPLDLTVTRIARFETGVFDGGGTEVVVHDNGKFYATNAADNAIDIYTVAGGRIGSISLAGIPDGGGVTSIAVKDGLIAAAVTNRDDQAPGFVALFTTDSATAPDAILTVGVLPDMVTFTPAGEVVVAIEGQPANDGSNDPLGGVSVITPNLAEIGLSTVATYDFTAFDGAEAQLRADGIRIRPGAPASRDFEPEYIAVDPQTGDLFVTLQENNAVAVFDMQQRAFTRIFSLNTTDHSVPGQGIDPSDRDDVVNVREVPVLGMRMADAIATFVHDGVTYYATANEGDTRDYAFFTDEARVAKVNLDPSAFAGADTLQTDAALGRLTISTIDGDPDGDGDFDQLYSFGSRSFTIFDENGVEIWDSGAQFEEILARDFADRFNVNNDKPFNVDTRSDAKGPEPEAIAIAEVDGHRIAVIGLERANGLMFYDITDPSTPGFLHYEDTVVTGDGSNAVANLLLSDLGPETIAVVSAEVSGSGLTEIAVANEVSGSVSVFTLDLVEPPVAAFTLQLLHMADQEAASQAVFDAPRASAVLNALEAADFGADASLRLSSGDAILPGLFFQASAAVFGRAGVADMIIQNELGWDAIAFGNHEFDFGSGFIADLIDGTFDTDGDAATPETALDYATDGAYDDETPPPAALDLVPLYDGTAFPYLSTNLDFSTEADLAPLEVPGGGDPMARTVTSSVVLEAAGELIGVVGATTPTIDFISSPGDLLVLPEAFDGTPTPAQIDALAAIIQAEVDALLAANPAMNKVILLAHMQQIAIEQALAARLTDVDIIVAGGSNTRLFDETDRARDGDSVQGVYPIVVGNAGGTDTLVVNTDGSYKYVGNLVIDFDADGNIIADSYDPAISGAYATDAQGVAELGAEGLIDPEIQVVADLIEAQILATEGNVFGISDVYLSGLRPEVRQQETNLGNLTADANLAEARKTDPSVLVSIKNGGGIRDDIGQIFVPAGGSQAERIPNEGIFDADGNVVKPAGGISQNDIGDTLRFNNDLTLLTLTGAELRAVLEHGIGASTFDETGPVNQQGRFPQVSGVSFSYDPDLPTGEKIVNAAVLNQDGSVAVELVRGGVTVAPETEIRIVTLGFLAGGGDGYPFPQDPSANRVSLMQEGVRNGLAQFADDGTEQDALAEYLAANFLTTPYSEDDTPIDQDTRIQNLNFRADAVFGEVGTPVAVLIAEFQPNPAGSDPVETTVELSGEAGAAFDLWLVSIENDGINGVVDRAANVTGTFNADGLAVVAVADLENPSFTYILTDAFTGAAAVTDIDANNDGAVDDLAAFGTILDAIGVADSAADFSVSYADDAALGGVAFAFTGTEPQLMFRDASRGDWYAVNAPGDAVVYDASGATVAPAAFDTDPTAAANSFGAINPGFIGTPADFDLQVTEIWPGQIGTDLTEDWFEITNFGTDAWTLAEGALFYDDESADPAVADRVQGVTAIAPGESVVVVIGGAADAAAFAAVWGDDGLPAGTQIGYADGAGLGQGGDAVALFLDAEADGLAAGDTPFETESFPDAGAASGRSWEVAAERFATLTAFTDTVATTELGGAAGDEPAVGSPGFIPTRDAGPDLTPISAIQGAGTVSPLVGQTVTVQGVVIGDYDDANELRGFFIQEEDADRDGDAATSEGVFVFTGAGTANVAEGQRVTVTGVVSEFFGMTQISAAADGVAIDDAGDNLALVTPTVLNRADFGANEDESAFEAVEGMLVTFADTLTVSEYFQLERYGQVVLYADGRPTQFTQDNAPDAAGFAAHRADLAGRRVILDDTNNINNGALQTGTVFHPQPGGFGVGVQGEDFFRGGDEVVSLTGVMHWSFAGFGGTDAWRVRPTEVAPAEFTPVNTREDNATPPDVGGALTVASFNVLNFFSTIDTTSNNSGPVGPSNSLDARGADSMAELDRQLSKLTEALALMNADIVGLIEIENDADNASARLIVDSLNAQLGAGTYALIETGFVGADAIKVGYIYKPGSVKPVGDPAILDDASFIDPAGSGGDRNRPAVAVSWEENASGEVVTTVANHFKSKGGRGATGLDIDQQDGAGAFNHTRTLAAGALIEWIGTNPTGIDDPDVLVLGDLNSYARETPIQRFEDAGFTNLADSFDPDAYSYLFDGQLGTLDYALSNAALTAQVTGAAAWHINADEVPLFDYNDDVRDAGEAFFEVRPGGNPLFSADPWRTSDHDPVIVGLDLQSAPDRIVIAGEGTRDRITGTEADEIIRLGAGRSETATGGGGSDVFEFFLADFANGQREVKRLTVDGDDLIDLGGAEITAALPSASGRLILTLAEDNDTLVISGLEDNGQIVNYTSTVFGDLIA